MGLDTLYTCTRTVQVEKSYLVKLTYKIQTSQLHFDTHYCYSNLTVSENHTYGFIE